jgi:hypothetical protein
MDDGDGIKKNRTDLDTEYRRPITPVTFSDLVDRPYTPEFETGHKPRPVSPYLRGPYLQKDPYYDDVEMDEVVLSSSRPVTPRSIRSARSVSPFSKVIIMDKPPEGVVLEPSPSPPASPPKVKKPRRFKKTVPEKPIVPDEPEVFKVPPIEEVLPKSSPINIPVPQVDEVIAVVSQEIIADEDVPPPEPKRKSSLRRSKPVEAREKVVKVAEPEEVEIEIDNIDKAPEDLHVKMDIEKENEAISLSSAPSTPNVEDTKKAKIIGERINLSVLQEKTNVEGKASPTPKPLPFIAVSSEPSREPSREPSSGPNSSPKKEKKGLVARLFEKRSKKHEEITTDDDMSVASEKVKETPTKPKRENKKDKKKAKEEAKLKELEEKADKQPKEKKGTNVFFYSIHLKVTNNR